MRGVCFLLALSASVLLVGCETPRAIGAAQPSQQASAASRPREICVSVEDTGSRLPQKECHTVDEWQRIKAHGAAALNVEADRKMGACVPGQSC
jgi:hypothetical protein